MQFIDLKAQYRDIKDKIDLRIRQVFEHGQFIMGPEVGELESRLSDYVGGEERQHCVGVSSGTDALLIALMALDIQPGDEVITTPFSFIATATMCRLLGVVPVFVDIDPRTYNLDPAGIEAVITAKTRVIMPVNLYGQCADYDAIREIADRHGIHIVEDAAQSFGATYKGRVSCTLGTIGCTSFYPAKPLGCYGDGGACFTADPELASRMRQIRNHGQDKSYHHVRMGINGRLDTLQAAILLAKLDVFDTELQMRARVAAQYDRLLSGFLEVPYVEAHNKSVYAQYTIQVDDRDRLIRALAEAGVPTAIHYPIAIHQQPLFAEEFRKYVDGRLKIAETASQRVLSLPFHPYLDQADLEKISAIICDYVK